MKPCVLILYMYSQQQPETEMETCIHVPTGTTCSQTIYNCIWQESTNIYIKNLL